MLHPKPIPRPKRSQKMELEQTRMPNQQYNYLPLITVIVLMCCPTPTPGQPTTNGCHICPTESGGGVPHTLRNNSKKGYYNYSSGYLQTMQEHNTSRANIRTWMRFNHPFIWLKWGMWRIPWFVSSCALTAYHNPFTIILFIWFLLWAIHTSTRLPGWYCKKPDKQTF